MFYYSQAISEFHKQLHRLANHILTFEMGIKANRTRFEVNRYRYPLNFITFEKEKTLGFFDPNYLQIGIHRHFLFANDEELLINVLRHELLHYLIHIQFGATVEPHGKEFKALCSKFAYSQDVYSATYDEYEKDIILGATHPKSQMLEKVKKLLRLSESSNPHEAQLALEKANQILISNQLSAMNTGELAEYHIKILTEGKRVSTKYQAIAEILHHFFVRVIFSHGPGVFRLEAFGRAEHIEFAEYVFHFLDKEIEFLWQKNKKQHGLKGLRAKNSFIWGLAEGFLHKLKQPKISKRELLVINQALTQSFQQHYKTKRSSQVGAQVDQSSQAIGKKVGSDMSINRPIQNSAKTYLLN